MHAINVGALLRTAKGQCAHGVFQNWIEENFEFSYRAAANYMKIAENKSLIESAKVHGRALSGIGEALRMIADDSPKTSRVTNAVPVQTFPPATDPAQDPQIHVKGR